MFTLTKRMCRLLDRVVESRKSDGNGFASGVFGWRYTLLETKIPAKAEEREFSSSLSKRLDIGISTAICAVSLVAPITSNCNPSPSAFNSASYSASVPRGSVSVPTTPFSRCGLTDTYLSCSPSSAHPPGNTGVTLNNFQDRHDVWGAGHGAVVTSRGVLAVNGSKQDEAAAPSAHCTPKPLATKEREGGGMGYSISGVMVAMADELVPVFEHADAHKPESNPRIFPFAE